VLTLSNSYLTAISIILRTLQALDEKESVFNSFSAFNFGGCDIEGDSESIAQLNKRKASICTVPKIL
jgi:hypothetical protein